MPFKDISVGIQPTLQAALASYVASESLGSEELYSCDKCH